MGIDAQLPRLDAGEVENVVEDPQQTAARRADASQHVALARAPGLVLEQLGQAQHGVERRADLVAHVGEEFGLGAVGGLRPHQGPLEPLAIAAQLFHLLLDGGLVGAVLQQGADLLGEDGEGLQMLVPEPPVKVPGGVADPNDEQGEAGTAGAGAEADRQLPQAPQRQFRQLRGRAEGGPGALETLRGDDAPQVLGIKGAGRHPDGGAGGLPRTAHGTGRPEEGELHLVQLQRRLDGEFGEPPRFVDADGPGVVGLDAREALQLPVEAVAGLVQPLLNHREARQVFLQRDDLGLELERLRRVSLGHGGRRGWEAGI